VANLSFYVTFLIALVFILAVGSNILSITYEIYAYYIKQRSGFLKKAIQDVLNDSRVKEVNLTELFYNHPQIDITKKTYRHLPAYISGKNFAQALMDVICRKYEIKYTRIEHPPDGDARMVRPDLPEDQLEKFRLGLNDLPYGDLKILLTGFVSNSSKELNSVQHTIETWYDEYMNRVNGWYKVRVQKRMLVLAAIVVVAINFDFFTITSTLLTDKELTSQIAAVAEKQQRVKLDSISNPEQLKQALSQRRVLLDSLYKLNAPIGWQQTDLKQMKTYDWVIKLLGWFISAAALSFGAPFWFDILAKLVNIRKTGIPPAKANS